jgi:hypothetical protein
MRMDTRLFSGYLAGGYLASTPYGRSPLRVILSSGPPANYKFPKSLAYMCCMYANFAWLHAYLTPIFLLLDLLEMWKVTQLMESVKYFAD